MSDYVVAIFPSRMILTKALDHLTQLEDFEFLHAAIVAKARDGEIVILGDVLSADEGGLTGGTLGAAMTALGLVQLGALALPGVGPIVALGAGALVGGLIGRMTGRFAANLLEAGFRNNQIEELAEKLHKGHPALVLEVENAHEALPRLKEELQPYQAEVVERLPETRPFPRTPAQN